MQLEARALTEEEKRRLEEWPPPSSIVSDLGELLSPAVGVGIVCALVVLFINSLVDAVSDFDALSLVGLGYDRVVVAIVISLVVASCVFLYMTVQELRWRRTREAKLADLFAREDVRVETHRIEEVRLVREPEHGQAMLFLRDDKGTVLFVCEHGDLPEDWEEQPLRISEPDQPRRELKILRHPETKDCVLLDFAGEALSFSECYVMNVEPSEWPDYGEAVGTTWSDLEAHYKLEKITS